MNKKRRKYSWHRGQSIIQRLKGVWLCIVLSEIFKKEFPHKKKTLNFFLNKNLWKQLRYYGTFYEEKKKNIKTSFDDA